MKKQRLAISLLIVSIMVLAAVSCRTAQPNQEVSQKIAQDFLTDSPTFKFDGIRDSLSLVSVDRLRSPYSWDFYFKFDCAHPGYGDRTGQILLQVITPHTARIRVMQGKVTEAVIDNKWDEIEQTTLESPPVSTCVP